MRSWNKPTSIEIFRDGAKGSKKELAFVICRKWWIQQSIWEWGIQLASGDQCENAGVMEFAGPPPSDAIIQPLIVELFGLEGG